MLGENVIIGTSPYDFKGFMGFRNFWMKDESGNYLARANSIWSLLDTQSNRPVRPQEDMMKKYPIEPRIEMEYASRRISVPEETIMGDTVLIKKHHLDTNHHVNNGQYITIAASCINEERRPTSVRVEYRNQARLKDVLYPYTDGRVVDLRSAEGTSYCAVDLMY